MACFGYLSELNDQEVLLTNQLGGSAAITLQLPTFEGEHHLQDPERTLQTTEAVIVTGDVHPVQVQQEAAVTADQNIQLSWDDTAAGDVEAQLHANLTLVPNQSDAIGWLRVMAASTLFSAAIVGVLFLPADLSGAHTIYSRVKLIASVGIPITVAAFSLFSSFCLNPQNNWVKGLTMINFSLLAGPLGVYWTLTRGSNQN